MNCRNLLIGGTVPHNQNTRCLSPHIGVFAPFKHSALSYLPTGPSTISKALSEVCVLVTSSYYKLIVATALYFRTGLVSQEPLHAANSCAGRRSGAPLLEHVCWPLSPPCRAIFIPTPNTSLPALSGALCATASSESHYNASNSTQ